MTIHKSLILIGLLLFSVSVVCAQEVQFGTKFLHPGQTVTRTAVWIMDIDVVLKFAGSQLGKEREESVQTVKKVETVLSVNGSALTGLRVFYEKWDTTTKTTEDGITENKPASKVPVVGKTYIVKVQGDQAVITDESGKKPPKEEWEIVNSDYKELGEPDEFLNYFADKKLATGETIQVPGEVARAILTEKKDIVKIDNFSFVLKGTGTSSGLPTAIFGTALKMSGNHGPNTSLKMNLKGETSIAFQNGWPVSMKLEGPVRVTGVDQIGNRIVMVDGTGKMTLTEEARYGK